MKAFAIAPVYFAFRNAQRGSDKLRGLQTFGPFKELPVEKPRFGFVFPSDCRDHANRLFLALKNGIGYFRGVENTFRFPLDKDQVFPVPVSGVSLSSVADHSKNAQAYVDAILSWNAKRSSDRPDMFFVLHPKTPGSQLGTPYYECKALLLREGLISQNVTLELLGDQSHLRWSAANIALGAFVKLGGVPWVVSGENLDKDLIIGLGRAYLYDPQSRRNTGYVAFTACFSARGSLKFVSLADLADSREHYLATLAKVVRASLDRTDKLGGDVTSLTIHAPKEMRREEMRVIHESVCSHVKKSLAQVLIVKVTEESQFFAVDPSYHTGVPTRGTAIQVTDRDLVLYTEGREETEPWTFRLPVALRVTPQADSLSEERIRAVLRQVNDLSQVNWRGMNARSKPISVYYGSLIAKLLSHIPRSIVADLHERGTIGTFEERIWFL